MTVTNDFQPFATGVGANVVIPATWIAATARFTGFQSGTASSALANTALRQGCFGTAMIGQFIADTLGQSVADNGNLATFEAQFISAIQQSVGSPAQSAFWHFGRDTGPVNVMQVSALPIVTGYSDGLMLCFLPNFSNTVSNPTLSTNGLTATAIVHADGTALNSGDITINVVTIVEYDSVLVKWRLVSQPGISFSNSRIVTVSGAFTTNVSDNAIGLARSSSVAISSTALPTTISGSVFIYEDLIGNFNAFPLTISPPGGHLISGMSAVVLNVNHQSAAFRYYGSNTWGVKI